MADPLIFDDLLGAVQNAIIKAHGMAQTQHLELLSEFFDESNKPVMIEMKVPTHHPNSNSDDGFDTIQVPKLCLVPLSGFRMKELNINFKVQFSELVKGENHEKGLSLLTSLPFLSAKNKQEPHVADVQITFEGTDPPEGILRINQHFAKFLP